MSKLHTMIVCNNLKGGLFMEKNENDNYKNGIIRLKGFIVSLLTSSGILKSNEHNRKNKLRGNFFKNIPNGFGVSIHFTGEKIDIDLIRDAGFKIVRKDIFWNHVEREKQLFNFAGYDQLTQSLIKNGIRPYYILDYSNSLYEKNRSVVTKEGQDAFVRYVSKVTSRYKGKGVIWEIWNEPNIGKFWNPQPNFDEYLNLVKRVSKTIKENDSSGIVVAPALAGLNDESLKWLEELLKKGFLNYIDALSVHPYRSQTPETVIVDYQKLRILLSKYSSKDITILSGEWGYSTAQGPGTANMNEYTQANYLVRMFLINLLSDIPISIWYDWKNDGIDLSNREHNFGIVQNDIKVTKKAYLAVNVLNHKLSKYQLISRIDVGNPNDYILHFKNKDNGNILVCWTSKDKHTVTVPFKYSGGHILSMFGEKVGEIKKASQLSLEVINSPKYIIVTNN